MELSPERLACAKRVLASLRPSPHTLAPASEFHSAGVSSYNSVSKQTSIEASMMRDHNIAVLAKSAAPPPTVPYEYAVHVATLGGLARLQLGVQNTATDVPPAEYGLHQDVATARIVVPKGAVPELAPYGPSAARASSFTRSCIHETMALDGHVAFDSKGQPQPALVVLQGQGQGQAGAAGVGGSLDSSMSLQYAAPGSNSLAGGAERMYPGHPSASASASGSGSGSGIGPATSRQGQAGGTATLSSPTAPVHAQSQAVSGSAGSSSSSSSTTAGHAPDVHMDMHMHMHMEPPSLPAYRTFRAHYEAVGRVMAEEVVTARADTHAGYEAASHMAHTTAPGSGSRSRLQGLQGALSRRAGYEETSVALLSSLAAFRFGLQALEHHRKVVNAGLQREPGAPLTGGYSHALGPYQSLPRGRECPFPC